MQEQIASWALLDPGLSLACPAVCSAAQGQCYAVVAAAASRSHTLLSWPFQELLGSIDKLATRTPLAKPAHSVHVLPGHGTAPSTPEASRALVVFQDGSVGLEPSPLNGGAPASHDTEAATVVAAQQDGSMVAVLSAAEGSHRLQVHSQIEVRSGCSLYTPCPVLLLGFDSCNALSTHFLQGALHSSQQQVLQPPASSSAALSMSLRGHRCAVLWDSGALQQYQLSQEGPEHTMSLLGTCQAALPQQLSQDEGAPEPKKRKSRENGRVSKSSAKRRKLQASLPQPVIAQVRAAS